MADLSTLERAIRAARRGHDEAARRLLDSVLDAEPDNEQALSWRARVTDDAGAKATFLNRVLAVNPNSRWASDTLATLGSVDAAAPTRARGLDGVGARVASIDHLQCPNCGGQIEVHPDRGSKSAVCSHCGSVLDLTSRQLDILGQVKPRFKPRQDIYPGAEATIEGERHVVIGWLRYKGWDDEETWTWDEWQLVSDSGVARYLSHSSDEGFLLQTPIRPTPKVTSRGIELPGGRVGFREVSPSKITGMAGELTWRPRLDETLQVGEARKGATYYSAELTADEVEVVAGRQMPPIEVWKALGRTDLVEALEKKAGRGRARRRSAAAMAKLFGLAFLAFLAIGIWVVPQMGGTVSQTSATYQSPAVALPEARTEREIVLHDTVEVGPITLEFGAAHTAQVTITSPVDGTAGSSGSPGVDVDVAFVAVDGDPVYRAPVPTLRGPRGGTVSETSRPFEITYGGAGWSASEPMRLVYLVRREWAGGSAPAWTEPVSFPISAEVRRVWLPGPFWFAATVSLFLAFFFFVFSRTGPR